MPQRLPECVIVSSDRYLDIQPYCCVIYNAEPDKWGDIFPWEFPQNATKEQEEAFLRLFFSESEIHMQGGAHPPGNGFRFLKQVWYSIAIWNLQHRVPAVANWWWERPDNKGVVKDTSMLSWIAKTHDRPDLFFDGAEIKTYGNKLLAEVIKHIRRTAEMLLVKPNEPAPPTTGAPVTSANGLQTVCRDVSPPVLSNIQHEQVKTRTEMSKPTESQSRAVSTSSTDYNSPVSTTAKPATASRAASNDYPLPPQDFQGQSRKRGYTGNRRYSNTRGGNFQNRMPYVHDQQMLSSPLFGNTPASGFHQPRVTPSGLVDFVPAPPPGMRGQPPMLGQAGPQQFGQQPFMNPHEVTSSMHFMQGHPHNFANNQPFDDRTNSNFATRPDMFEPQYTGDKSNYSTSYRRNSQSIRGKPRANPGFRGRGSRGRNSFSTSDQQPPNFAHNQNFDPARFDHPPAQPVYMSNKNRRGSIFGEKNWRSGSEHPQVPQPEQHAFKENMAPTREFSGAYRPYVAAPGAMDSINDMGEHRLDVIQHPLNSMARPVHGPPPRAFNHGQFSQQPQIDYDSLTEDQKCGEGWIGENCTFCLKLLVMNVPRTMSEMDLQFCFNRFCKVIEVSRMPSPRDHPSKGPIPVFWLQFSTADEARKCLAMRPDHWPDGTIVHIEVPKEYWDPTHYQFQRNFLRSSSMQPWQEYRPPEILRRPDGNLPEAEPVVDRPEETTPKARDKGDNKQTMDELQSGETTPTPSAANTPKKKPSKGEKKKRKEELRKLSMVASADQQIQSANTVGDSHPVAQPTPVEISTDPSPPMNLLATEVQTASEPSFTPTDIVETRLPANIDTAPKESQRSTSGQTEVQTTSEPSFTPTTLITTCLPPDPAGSQQLFRAGEKKEEKETVVGEPERGEPAQPKASDGDSRKQGRESQRMSDDSRIDESFHTASDSPASTQVSGLSAVAAFIPAESEDHAPSEKTVAVTVAPEQTISEKAAAAKVADTDIGPQSAAILPTTSSEAKKGKKKVQIPQLETKSAKKIVKRADTKPESAQPNQRNTSNGSDGPPTSAYVTAPNTPRAPGAPSTDDEESDGDDGNASSAPFKRYEIPAVSENADKSEKSPKLEEAENKEDLDSLVEQEKPEKSEKPSKSKKSETPEKSDKTEKQDKPKGPAQTESLSLFGKKKGKDKKPRSKKGTLKGKPKTDDASCSDVMSGNTSRAVSIAEPEAGTGGPGASEVMASPTAKSGGEAMLREDSKFDNNRNDDSKCVRGSETTVPHDSGYPPQPQQGSPKKHRSLFGHISTLFGGGQQTHTPPRNVADNTISDQSSLTGSKTQNRPLSIDTTAPVDGFPSTAAVGRDMVRDSIAKDEPIESIIASWSTQGAIVWETDTGALTADAAVESHTASDAVISAPTADGASEHKAKKKNKKGKRSKKKSVGHGGDTSEPSTPTPKSTKDGKSPLEMHVFGSGKVPAALEDVSDVSSHTLGRSTPSSDLQSPTEAMSSRKLPAKAPGQGELVEAKVPQWQKRKRQPYQRALDHDDNGDAKSNGDEKEAKDDESGDDGKDDEPNALPLPPKGTQVIDLETASIILNRKALPSKQHKKMYVYVGQGKMDDDNNEEADLELELTPSANKSIDEERDDASE